MTLPPELTRRLKVLHAEADAIEALTAREVEAWGDFAWTACSCGGSFIAQAKRRQRYCSDACRVRAWRRDEKAKADRRAKRRATMEAE